MRACFLVSSKPVAYPTFEPLASAAWNWRAPLQHGSNKGKSRLEETRTIQFYWFYNRTIIPDLDFSTLHSLKSRSAYLLADRTQERRKRCGFVARRPTIPRGHLNFELNVAPS